MKDQLQRQFQLISEKYRSSNLTSLPSYQYVQDVLADEKELDDIAAVLDRVVDGDKIFNISKQINKSRGDQRLFEAFAEFDTAKNLVTTKFYGDFRKITYLPPMKNRRWPDILADETPVEVKLLTPQDLVASKFFQKLIDKINKDAAPQLASYHDQHSFDTGMIFIRSHRPVPLADIKYHDLEKWFNDKVLPQPFDVTIVTIMHGIPGMWDFYIKKDST